ncbi:MAG: peptidoglycan-binding protein [Hyphomonadaceae bacterium]|nr:MAG: peptidoglycan-binding protein [Hyphomonadaceae bacterium]KAF0187171.1 MAG: peptidoglycan-binding protein [Hyphomonadaceae bacterium]
MVKGEAMRNYNMSLLATTLLAIAIPATASAGHHQAQAVAEAPNTTLPSGAHAGQCFARRLVPATYRNAPMSVVTQEAVEGYEITDPVFEARPQTVVTRDGYSRYEVTEPVFRAESSSVVTRPAYERLVATQAQIGTRSEVVVIREPRMVWRRGENLSGVRRLDPNSGEIYCLVEERGVTQTVTRRVVTNPAVVSVVNVPAQVQTITRQVLAAPAQVREIRVPEQTQTIQIQELANRATARKTVTPEQTSTINRQELVTAEHYEWVQVACDNSGAQHGGHGAAVPGVRPVPHQVPMGNGANNVVVSTTSLQRALAELGLYRGPIDGIYGPLTREAVAQFQRANHLTVTGRVNADVVRGLGLGQK